MQFQMLSGNKFSMIFVHLINVYTEIFSISRLENVISVQIEPNEA